MADTASDARVNPRQGKAWNAEEDRRVYDGFVAGRSVDTLASEHGRSPGGIRARLGRIGLIDQDGEVVTPVPPFVPVKRRVSAASGTGVDEDALQSVFGVRTADGWAVELRSNRPLSRPLVDRLVSMLNGVVSDDEER